MSDRIPFNNPFIAGKELFDIAQAVTLGEISGDGTFTKDCCHLLEQCFDSGVPIVYESGRGRRIGMHRKLDFKSWRQSAT